MERNKNDWPTITIESQVDPRWIDFIKCHADMFQRSYSGYWLCGIERDPKLGWLAFEHGDEVNPRSIDHSAAIAAWESGAPLPPKYYKLDRELAVKAWAEGVKLRGLAWWDKADGSFYDEIIQHALLGEVRYG